MAINKKLIHFKKKENFDNEVANGNILDNSIVFIQDSKEISTHGTVYKTVNWSILEKYKWVDLGLPSGTLWAAWNVGATKPEEYGLYFAWGETEGYEGITDEKQFSWADYKWCNGSNSTLTKYNNNSSNGTVDNLTTLELEDDAAYVSDKTCRMPTKDECQELIDNTTSKFETLNGVNGRRFTSKTNGNSIFVPATGFCNYGSFFYVGSLSYLRSSSLFESDSKLSWYLYFNANNVFMDWDNRYYGFSVRPVKSK